MQDSATYLQPFSSVFQRPVTWLQPPRKVTPAMAARLTDHVWSVAELLAVAANG